MAKRVYDAVVVTGSYTNKAGDEKKNYSKIGTVFENDKGQLSLKLDLLPLGKEFSGWINFYEPKPREGGSQAQQDEDEDGSIPF